MDGIQVYIDKQTYKLLSEIASRKQNTVLEELSRALKKHVDVELQKLHEVNEGKQLLCEG